jgi:ADP-ribosylglycohydrolase
LVELGEFDIDDVWESYVAWRDSKPFDIGNTISTALRGIEVPASQANGALMRISPLGIFGANYSLEQVQKWAMADAELTHANLVCQQINALYTMSIAHAVRTPTSAVELCELIEFWSAGTDPLVRKAILDAKTLQPADFMQHQGWVIIAFQNALYQLRHAPDPETAIVDTVMRGGDTDTNAAIVGALVGAVHGVDAFPPQWIRSLETCRPEEGNPEVRHPRPVEYWPCDVLALAEALLG